MCSEGICHHSSLNTWWYSSILSYFTNLDDHHNTSSSEKKQKQKNNNRHHLHSSVDSYHKLAPTSGASASVDRSRAAESRRTRNSWNKSPTTPRRIMQIDLTTTPGDILEASMRQIDSLEQQLQKSEDNRRRQYESMMRQMQTNAEQIIILKKKLHMSHEECSDYKQQYVLKDRELQVTLVHLEAAQSEMKQLKHQLSKVGRLLICILLLLLLLCSSVSYHINCYHHHLIIITT